LPGVTRARFSTHDRFAAAMAEALANRRVSVRFNDSVLPPRATHWSSVSLIRSFHQQFHNSKTGKRASARPTRLTVKPSRAGPERPKPAKPRRLEDRLSAIRPGLSAAYFHILRPEPSSIRYWSEAPITKGTWPCRRGGLKFAPIRPGGLRRFVMTAGGFALRKSLVDRVEPQ
jgi:hypothetical protein